MLKSVQSKQFESRSHGAASSVSCKRLFSSSFQLDYYNTRCKGVSLPPTYADDRPILSELLVWRSLVYLPCGIGGVIAAYTTNRLLDRDYIRKAKRYNFPINKSSNDVLRSPIKEARLLSFSTAGDQYHSNCRIWMAASSSRLRSLFHLF